MTKTLEISTFSMQSAKNVHDAIMAAIKDVGETFGVTFEKNGGKLESDFSTIFKIRSRIKPNAASVKNETAARKANWAANAPELGLKVSHFGQTIETPRGTYVLYDIHPNRPKNPISMKRSDGKLFKTTVSHVASYLKGAMKDSGKTAATTKPAAKVETANDSFMLAVQTVSKFIGTLRNKWQNEKSTDDFADYITSAKKAFKKHGIEVLSMSKSFVLKLKRGGETATLTVRGSKVTIERGDNMASTAEEPKRKRRVKKAEAAKSARKTRRVKRTATAKRSRKPKVEKTARVKRTKRSTKRAAPTTRRAKPARGTRKPVAKRAVRKSTKSAKKSRRSMV